MAAAGLLGVGVFVVIAFLAPNPKDVSVPYFLKVYLPQADDRDVPLPEPQPETDATLTFVGDIMLARAVERTIVENGTDWPFANLGDLFAGSDLVIGNFEGTVREQRNLEVVNQMVFDTTPDNVAMLADTGFTHLSLANNHTDDYGPTVTESSRQAIAEAGMKSFGDPLQSEQHVVRENIGGVSLSLIGFHAFSEDPDTIVEAIKLEKSQGRFVIVFPHWGPEYVSLAPAAEIDPAKQFVHAGADLIIGAHPHVIQNVDVIDGVPVVYSLGNFLFDQDFSTETQQGLTVKVHISDDSLNLTFTPVSIKNRQTTPMEATAAQKILDTLGLPSGQMNIPRQ